MIFAFVGAIQLRQFGADIYVANLVAVAMAREMGAVMTAIVLAGRTGAAFAAQIGTMQVNEEIDALATLGMSPIEFLVLPRMLALILMMPLLCIYADVMGILGGFVVGISTLNVTPTAYLLQTQSGGDHDRFRDRRRQERASSASSSRVTGCLRGHRMRAAARRPSAPPRPRRWSPASSPSSSPTRVFADRCSTYLGL